MKIVFLIVFSLTVLTVTKSQTPSQDPNFILDIEDNFTSLDSSLWNPQPYNNPAWGWGWEKYDPNHVNAIGGVLSLWCNKLGTD
jgi:hypothetical protein